MKEVENTPTEAAPQEQLASEAIKAMARGELTISIGAEQNIAFEVNRVQEDTIHVANKSPQAVQSEANQNAINQSAEMETESNSSATIETPGQAVSGTNQVESANEGLAAEERAAQIWTPVQYMASNTGDAANDDQRRRKHGVGGIDPETWRGSGARGQAYETSGYKLTFGGLSSY